MEAGSVATRDPEVLKSEKYQPRLASSAHHVPLASTLPYSIATEAAAPTISRTVFVGRIVGIAFTFHLSTP